MKDYFDPKPIEFPFPEDTGSHYLPVNMDRGIKIDKDYPYINKDKKFLFGQFWLRIVIFLIVMPITYLRLGLIVKGRKNLRKYKKVINEGCITVTNHVHMWDYLALMSNFIPCKWPHVLVWDKNINGENGPLVKVVGGIPIPVNDMEASNELNKAVSYILNEEKGVLQIYAEGSMWEYYRPIRPLKSGVAYYAIKNNKPIIPMAYSYRKPGWIRRVIFKQKALFTLNIGEPIYPNNELGFDKAKDDLLIRLHNEMAKLAHLTDEENMYEPIYNNSKRIDYYTSEYGKGYKTSK